jgi:hypothetical protein
VASATRNFSFPKVSLSPEFRNYYREYLLEICSQEIEDCFLRNDEISPPAQKIKIWAVHRWHGQNDDLRLFP